MPNVAQVFLWCSLQHLSSTLELDKTSFFLPYWPSLPSAKMDITRQCILWGLLGKVLFVVVLVFKQDRKQLWNQDRSESPCTVWGRTVSGKAYRPLSSTAWCKVLTSHWGLFVYSTVFWLNSYRATELKDQTHIIADFMETCFPFHTYKAPNNILSESQP